MANIISWEGVMQGALALPGVEIDRDSFLQSTFGAYGDTEKLINQPTTEVYSPHIIEKVAQSIVNNQTLKTTGISTLAGFPGGLAMLGTIPADLAQYYCNFLILAQKLAYVYGWPDLRDEHNNLGEGAQAILTLFLGVAFGADGASAAVRAVARTAGEAWAKRLPAMALTKTVWYPILKEVMAYLGVKITKDTVGRSAGKIIPILGGLISGGITYATFKPMANKLKKELAMVAEQRLMQSKGEVYIEEVYTE